MKEFNAVIGGIVGFLFLIVVGVLWRAWVLTQLWAWLVVPIFHFPALRLIGAYTISLIVAFLTVSRGTETSTENKASVKPNWPAIMGKTIGWTLLGPAVSLGVGWIAHFFV